MSFILKIFSISVIISIFITQLTFLLCFFDQATISFPSGVSVGKPVSCTSWRKTL